MNATKKVIVFGSRSWTDKAAIRERLALLAPGTVVVHGASPGGGADLIADEEARKLDLPVIPVPINDADRRRAQRMARPRFAPLARNIRMAHTHADADLAYGFWDGTSSGSKHMRDVCRQVGIPVVIVSPQAEPKLEAMTPHKETR